MKEITLLDKTVLSDKNEKITSLFKTIYTLAVTALVLVLLLGTDLLISSRNDPYVDISDGWLVNGTETMNIDAVSAGNYGGKVRVEKKLPDTINENDAICFSSKNSNFRIYLDGKLQFEFSSRENFTGFGYGTAYHSVNLCDMYSAKTIAIEIESSFKNQKGGRIGTPVICTDDAYRHILIDNHFVELMLSSMVLLSGICIIILIVIFSKKIELPYKLGALGVTLILTGLWSLGDTNIPQYLSGHLYVWRILDYTLLHLAIYPIVRFIDSLLKRKSSLYCIMAFASSFSVLTAMCIWRYAFGGDMSQMGGLIYFDYCMVVIIVSLMLISNTAYCQKHGIKTDLGLFYLAIFFFVAGILIDLIGYAANVGALIIRERGDFLRIGLAGFSAVMVIQACKWWMREQTTINRDRFINSITQLAVSESGADTSINAMLEYLCNEFRSDRAYIFEDMNDGTFDNTYEFCKEGVTPEIDNLKGLPYEGIVDVWYNEYYKSNNILIYDIEAYKSVSEPMYNVLKPQGINTLVTGPLVNNGKYIGFFGVDNPPKEIMDEVSEIIRLLSYVLTQLVLHRDDQERLLRYSYYDAMTGAKNRRALDEFEKRELDPSKPYGYVMCDINELKQTNDSLGHEAGDELIKSVCNALTEIFGAGNVYRTGGDEFVVYTSISARSEFEEAVNRFKKILKDSDRNAAVGAVYREAGDYDIKRVQSEADALMYEDKRTYYMTHKDRRSH